MKMAKGARILKSEIMYLYIVFYATLSHYIILHYIIICYITLDREQEGQIQRVVKPAAFIT
jgi:hypothetical protein